MIPTPLRRFLYPVVLLVLTIRALGVERCDQLYTDQCIWGDDTKTQLQLTYTAIGNLNKLTDSLGNSTDFGYAASGNLNSLTDANGVVTSFTHDSRGRELSMMVKDDEDNVLRTESYTYDTNGNRLTSTTTRTKQDGTVETLETSFTYDAENRVLETTLPDGTKTSLTYNSIGKQATTTDQLGRVTSYTYDNRGNVSRMDYFDGTFSTSTFDVEGRTVASTNREGTTSYSVYDALGRMTQSILPDDTMPATVLDSVADILASTELADNPRSITEFDADGRVIASVDALGNRTEFEYDGAGRRVLVRDALGNETETVYNEVGSQTSATDALGRTTEFTYDLANRLTKTTFSDSTSTSVVYDDLGRRQSVTDQEGNITFFQYDSLGRMVGVIDAEGGVTQYEYNERGDLLVQRDALGRETKYVYDTLGRRIGRTLPNGETESMTYSTAGNMLTRTDFNGHTTSYEYDSRNRISAIVADATHPSLTLNHAPARFEFGYDGVDRRVSAVVKNASGTVLYQDGWIFDDRGRLDLHSSTNGNLGYAYDDNNLLSGVMSDTVGGYDQSFDYDALNRLTIAWKGQEGDDANAYSLAAYGYNSVGSLTGIGYSNGIGHSYNYSTLNRLKQLTVGNMSSGVDPPSIATLQQQYTYTLNQAGHRTKIEELSGRTVDHVFDKLYRLKSETIINDPNAINGAINYTLDAVGNRLSRTSSVTGVSNQDHTYTVNDHLTGDTHDSNGNTITSPIQHLADHDGNYTDVYDFRNKLIQRTYTGGKLIHLEYSADGNRVHKTVFDGFTELRQHNYLVDSNNHTGYAQVVEEKDGLGVLTRVNNYGHDLVATEFKDEGYTRYYQYDGHGSVRALSDDNGVVTDEYTYDAFGLLVGSVGATPNVYLYTGEQWDADLGMYFLRARYVNVETGRFHSMDTYEGRRGEPLTLHKYLYTHGNPVSNIDPSGNVTLGQVGAGLSGLLTLHGVYTAIKTPTWANIGLAAFDVGTLGAGKYLTGIGKALFAWRAGRAGNAAARYARAFKGGKQALEAYKFRLRGTVLGLHSEITAAIRTGAKGVFESNHINQVAAFLDIPKGLGLAIPLAGSAKTAGTQHWRFHKYMDDFWDGFRGFGDQPNDVQYHMALYNAMVDAGQHAGDARVVADAAIAQAKHFGYFVGERLINIPGRTTARAR